MTSANDHDEALLLRQVAVAALDASLDALPDEVTRRLEQARHGALASVGFATSRASTSRWLPSLAMAATLLLAVGIWHRADVPPVPLLEDTIDTRVAEHAELLEELEFLAWMELQGGDGDGAASEADHAG